MLRTTPVVCLLLCSLAAQDPTAPPERQPRRAPQGNQYARMPGIRPDVTIFSPLDLPSPNRYRTASGAPGPDYWQQQVDYQIDVSLDPEKRLIEGKEHVTYVNNSPDPLDYVWVHLEQNILRQDSIGNLIGGQRAVGGASDPSEGVEIRSLGSHGKPLTYAIYDTMMRVDLPATLAPKSEFEFDVSWAFEVPSRVFRRYGTINTKKGIVWELAQWFPAVAVYDDVHGWNTLPYIGTGEFYNNFGTFDVSITVPHDHLVVATGLLQNPTEVYTDTQLQRFAQARQSSDTVMIRSAEEVGDPNTRPQGDGLLTWKFHAEKVRTFAWASSPAFILDAAASGDKLIQSAYYEEVAKAWSKSTQMLKFAIEGYSKQWFPYPYPVATNVAGVEGGMEYPMIIFCRGTSERGLYGVTTHEIGHNWFPMTVNTDERRHAWMDEGFNTFINIYSEADYFKRPDRLRGAGMARMMTLRSMMVPIDTPADRLDGMQLGMLEYQMTGLGMQILREYVLGEERFDAAFRSYIRRWAFKSPQPADFYRSMEDGAGMDLAWFFRGWFIEHDTLDQAVDSVTQGNGRRRGRVSFVNRERMVMPLEFKVTFEDGTTEEHKLPIELWYRADMASITLDSPKVIKEVVIDPGNKLPDIDRSNNVWEAESKDPAKDPAKDR